MVGQNQSWAACEELFWEGLIFFKRIYICCAYRVPFWRFLITGADQNRELKMWCTVSWTCLQTVRYVLVDAPEGWDLQVLNLQR